MYTEEQLISGAIRNSRVHQEALYNKFASKMFAVCLRYGSDRMIAEDILQEGFIRVFTKLNQFKSNGSFEGWIRRIMVNTALQHIRREKSMPISEEADENLSIASNEESAIDKMTVNEILEHISQLPKGYRLVFNLYVFEEYTHEQIAAELGISEGTSKSQLARARKYLQKMLKKNENTSTTERIATVA